MNKEKVYKEDNGKTIVNVREVTTAEVLKTLNSQIKSERKTKYSNYKK